MSRTGSFPLHTAFDLLKQYSDESAVVLDPFCGKGTSLLAARMLGLSAYGLDVAPEAVICARAKLSGVSCGDVVSYVKALRPYAYPHTNAPYDVQCFFHPSTLSRILGLKVLLLRDLESADAEKRELATFAICALLGILHGHASYSLSLPCAHAYAMAPGYVRKYATANSLVAPARDVKQCLVQKIERCLKTALPDHVPGEVHLGSVKDSATLFPSLKGRVDLILTSPPYLNAQTYAKDNWLRLWCLGYDHKELKSHYIETGSVRLYRDHMRAALLSMVGMLKPGGRLICIAGDVRLNKRGNGDKGTVFETGTFLGRLCSEPEMGLRVEYSDEHKVSSQRRYYHAISQSTGHTSADLVERVFVAQRDVPCLEARR